jgi:uncharacterized repeat protein (TIGR01451 family)
MRVACALTAALLPVAFLVGDGSARSSAPTLRPLAGAKVAFARGFRCDLRSDFTCASVHVLDLTSSRETWLGGEFDGRPRWSPDGTLIAFSPKEGDIYVVRPDGTGRRRITSPDEPDYPGGTSGPEWSPDGTKLAIVKGAQLRVVDVATGRWRLLAAAKSMWPPTWSPDGKWIAFVAVITGPAAIYAASVERPRPLRVLDGHGGLDLSWSPDGSALVSRDFAPVCCGWSSVYVTPVGGSGRQRVADGDLWGGRPWSPDGRKIVYRPSGSRGLYVMNRDGSGQTKLTSDGSQPSWSADGTSIVFVRGWPRPGLFAVKPDGTGETRLNEDAYERDNLVMQPEWQPLAATLSMSSQTRRQTRAAGAVRYTIKVRNRGSAQAEQVVVRVRLPRSARVVGRQPAGACTGGPHLICRFRRIAPNAAATVALAVRLRREGLARTRVSVSTTTFEPNRSDNELEIRTSPS